MIAEVPLKLDPVQPRPDDSAPFAVSQAYQPIVKIIFPLQADIVLKGSQDAQKISYSIVC